LVINVYSIHDARSEKQQVTPIGVVTTLSINIHNTTNSLVNSFILCGN